MLGTFHLRWPSALPWATVAVVADGGELAGPVPAAQRVLGDAERGGGLAHGEGVHAARDYCIGTA